MFIFPLHLSTKEEIPSFRVSGEIPLLVLALNKLKQMMGKLEISLTQLNRLSETDLRKKFV